MSAVLVAEDAPVDVPILSARQQHELLRQPDKRTRLGKRDAALLAVLVGSGCRIGEAVRLRVQDSRQMLSKAIG
jgi:site-specific recombinase XerD